MANADYYLCDCCGERTFYDADLEYCDNGDSKMLPNRVGKMLVLCKECAKTKEIIIADK